MSEKIYLLTGAAGLLGSNISRQLIRQGSEVRALVLQGDPALSEVPAEAEVIVGDITDQVSLDHFFKVAPEKEIIVIHCASIVTVSDIPNPKVYEVNVNGTKNIIRKCLEHRVKKLVYVSSTSAIPEVPAGRPIKEVEEFSADSVIGFYGKTKAEATQAVLDAVKKDGLDASIIFPSGICGPNDFAYGPVSSFLIEYVNGQMKGGVAGFFNAVDVRDLARGCIAGCEKGRKGESYIMANQLVSMREMFDLLSELSGCKNVKTILPIGIARFMAKFGDLKEKITGKPGRLTSFAVYNMGRNNNFDYQKATEELGFHVRPFRETIRDELCWLQAEGKIRCNMDAERYDKQLSSQSI